MRISAALAILCPVLLAGCAPGHYTTYEIVPPTTPEGISCANACLINLATCTNRCEAESRLCRMANTFTDRRLLDRPMFDDGECESGFCVSRCEQTFRICHANCGGKVIPHTCIGSNCPTYITPG